MYVIRVGYRVSDPEKELWGEVCLLQLVFSGASASKDDSRSHGAP